MNARQYLEFLERIRLEDESCKYGHYGCSDKPGGMCSDEEYANLSDADRETVDC